MDSNVFGQPDMQQEPMEKEGNNPTLIAILLILILGGAAGLGFLLYRQSQEEPAVLDEVVETIELPTDTIDAEVTNELPVLDDSDTILDESTVESGILDNETTLPTPVE
jgi:flagellar basal body-associated protein FliL